MSQPAGGLPLWWGVPTMTDEPDNTDPTETRKNINESADKIRLETQVKRGDGTRDEDRMKVKIRGDNPEATAARLRETLDALAAEGVATELRATRAEETND